TARLPRPPCSTLFPYTTLFRSAVAALREFYRRVQKGAPLPVRELTGHLFSLLQDLQVPRSLERWCREAEQAGGLDRALEHKQLRSAEHTSELHSRGKLVCRLRL